MKNLIFFVLAALSDNLGVKWADFNNMKNLTNPAAPGDSSHLPVEFNFGVFSGGENYTPVSPPCNLTDTSSKLQERHTISTIQSAEAISKCGSKCRIPMYIGGCT